MRIIFHIIIKILPIKDKRDSSKFLSGITAISTTLAGLLIAGYQIGLLPYNPENIQLIDEDIPTYPTVQTMSIELQE